MSEKGNTTLGKRNRLKKYIKERHGYLSRLQLQQTAGAEEGGNKEEERQKFGRNGNKEEKVKMMK